MLMGECHAVTSDVLNLNAPNSCVAPSLGCDAVNCSVANCDATNLDVANVVVASFDVPVTHAAEHATT